MRKSSNNLWCLFARLKGVATQLVTCLISITAILVIESVCAPYIEHALASLGQWTPLPIGAAVIILLKKGH